MELDDFADGQDKEQLLERLASSRRSESSLKSQLKNAQVQLEKVSRSFDLVQQVGEYVRRPQRWEVEPPAGKHAGHPLLFVSDTHFDEVVRAEEIFGLNAYNRDIAEMRLRKAFEGGVKIARDYVGQQYAYDGATVAFGGDMLTGIIHEEYLSTNEAPPSDTVDYFTDPLISGLQLWLEEFGQLHVAGVVGNHDRMSKKVPSKYRAIDSWSWVLYKNLARHFKKNDKITFDIAESPETFIEAYDTRILMHHGNDFYGGSGISGFLSPLALGDHRKRRRNMSAARITGNRDLEFDLQLLGHFHQRIVLPGITVGSSLKGYDEYARGRSFDYAEPSQELIIITPERGVTFQQALFVMDRREEGW